MLKLGVAFRIIHEGRLVCSDVIHGGAEVLNLQKPGQYICCQNHKLIADIEDDIMDPDTFPFILSFTHCGNKVILRVLRIILVILPEHPSDTKDHLKMEMEMEIPSVKASANSDIIFFFTSAQDGNKLLDDERLSLADDLKKAHDQNQNKSK
ncbi:hypothetical protein Tco_1172680 [Tanacetum coccineum]